jgi:hypothetical protein
MTASLFHSKQVGTQNFALEDEPEATNNLNFILYITL